MSLAVYLIQGAALWAGVVAITGEALSYGAFVQFWLLLNMLVRPIRELGERYNVLQSAFASAERIFQVLDTAPTVVPPATPAAVPTAPGQAPRIAFEDVCFSYVEDTPVLRGVSFEIPPGKTVAVVGATGAASPPSSTSSCATTTPPPGASPSTTSTSATSPSAFRARFGLVLQEDFLFAGSASRRTWSWTAPRA